MTPGIERQAKLAMSGDNYEFATHRLPGMYQELMLVEKDDEGKIHTRNILGVAFVPLQEETLQQ